MLERLFGNRTAAKILIFLEGRKGAHATEISRELIIPLNMVQKQLVRFEREGLLTSRLGDRRRIYQWNARYPLRREFEHLLGAAKAHLRRRILRREEEDPADGSHLTLKERISLADELEREAERLNPYPRYKPFVKTFKSLKEYETWRKKQTNPWLV